MKKLSTAITAFLICAAVFASTTQFDQAQTECVELHEHCLEKLACDELCQEELGLAGQILVANRKSIFSWDYLVLWRCIYCCNFTYEPEGEKPSPYKGRCCAKFHHWVRKD